MGRGLRVWLGLSECFPISGHGFEVPFGMDRESASLLTVVMCGDRPIHERLTKKEVEDVIESYKRMNWWP